MIQFKNEYILCSHLSERMNLSVLIWNDLEVRLREKNTRRETERCPLKGHIKM